jgi:nucleoside phosphorylase
MDKELAQLCIALRHSKQESSRSFLLSEILASTSKIPLSERLFWYQVASLALITHCPAADNEVLGILEESLDTHESGKYRMNQNVDLLIVTLKLPELYAVQSVFDLPISSVGMSSERGFQYWTGEFKTTVGKKTFAVAFVGEAGNKQAAVATGIFLARYNPSVTFLIGMGGGVPRTTAVGDVVVSEAVLDQSIITVLPRGQNKINRSVLAPTPHLLRTVFVLDVADLPLAGSVLSVCRKAITQAGGLVALPPGFEETEYSPKLHKAVLRGADELVEDGSLKNLNELHARAKLTDMESAGFALACTQLGQPWVVWRGVADYGRVTRQKGYQFISTVAAAVCARTYLERYTADIFPT